MRKFLVFGLCVMVAVLMVGCSVSSAAGASRAANATAKRADAVVGRLESVNQEEFNFPTAFGTDNFFVGGGVHAGYEPGHFCLSELNFDNPARVEFMNKLDDLYILCADITAANNAQARLIESVKHETAQMRILASELATMKFKHDWSEFNKVNKDVDETLRLLNKDRNAVAKKLKILPRSSVNINPEAMFTRYSVVMDRLDNRVEMLEDLLCGLQKMNQELRLFNPPQRPQPPAEPITTWLKNPPHMHNTCDTQKQPLSSAPDCS